MVTYSLPDLFPECVLPTCEQKGTTHRHILPVQQIILDSHAKYLYMQGGVGGGKSVGFAAKCVDLTLKIPKNRIVVARHNLDDLYDSSWRKVVDCFTSLAERDLIPNPTPSKKVSGVYTEYRFHNDSELKAIHGKNWRRGMGADHGGFWVDDALECLEEFFIGTEVSAGLLSRLRLPHVRFWPALWSESTPHGALHGMVSSNPPPVGHWLHKLFGSTPGIHNIGEDIVEWYRSETTDNPFMGANYAKGLIAVQQKLGRDSNTVRRVIFGESIPAYGGVKVFPQFEHERHVAALKYDSSLPLIRSWDFGTLHPAVVFSQLYTCQYGRNHFFTLSEVAECFNVTVYTLMDDFVTPHTKQYYSEAKVILDAGDRAGYRASSSSKDRRGDMKILIDEYNLPFRHRYLNLAPSLQYMAGLLEPKNKCQCGLEDILISNDCPVLIGALEGGYKYSKTRDGKVSEKPVEDRYFADVACAWRYGAENFVKWGIGWEAQKELRTQQRSRQHNEPWAWMTLSDKEFAQLLIR